MISINSCVRELIEAEGTRAYPDECCGVLLGAEDETGRRFVSVILPLHNGRESEERYHRFVIEPDDFIAAERTARERGLSVLGFYHSHPDHPAEPSGYDLEHAIPWYSYVILGVNGGRPGDLTSWTLAPDRSGFGREFYSGARSKAL
jgi:proteasome lid subunit RPN8/RPN11